MNRSLTIPAIGYAIREQNRPILDDPAINAAEITFERADDPLRVDRYLQELDFDHVSVHALKLSVASPEPPNRTYLDALRAIAIENGASSVSDHLGFTRDGDNGVEMGHFAPPPWTEAALTATCRNIDHIQKQLGDTRFYIAGRHERLRQRDEFQIRSVRVHRLCHAARRDRSDAPGWWILR